MINIKQQEINDIIRDFNTGEDIKIMRQKFMKRFLIDDIIKLKQTCEILNQYKLKIYLNNYKFLDSNSFIDNTMMSIKKLGLPKFYEWSMDTNITINFNTTLDKDDAQFLFYFNDNKPVYNCIELPPLLTTIQQKSLFHELGHMAYYENKTLANLDCYEYTEVLSILLEYLYQLTLGNQTIMSLYFESARTATELQCGRGFLICCKYNNSSMLIENALERYIYFKSTDIAYQLIDLMNENREDILKYIDDALTGYKMLKDIHQFNINTEGFNRLITSAKTLGKRR